MDDARASRLAADVLSDVGRDDLGARPGKRVHRTRRFATAAVLTLVVGIGIAAGVHQFWGGRHSTTTLPFSEAIDIYTGRLSRDSDAIRSAQALLFSYVDGTVKILKTLRDHRPGELAADAERGLVLFRSTLGTHTAPLPSSPERIPLRELLRFVGDDASDPKLRREYLVPIVEQTRLALALLFSTKHADPNVAADQQKLQQKLAVILAP